MFLCGAICGAKGNNLGPPDNESKWLCDNISHIHCVLQKSSFMPFFHFVAQKLGFQTSGESTGNAELLSQFIVQGKQSRWFNTVLNQMSTYMYKIISYSEYF